MDDAFQKLKDQKNNTVDGLVKWMKDSKLIDESKEADEKARKLFADVKDAKDVELSKFKSALTKLAEDQKKNVDDFYTKLAAQGAKVLEALMAGAQAGATAFNDAMKKETK